MCCAPGAGRRVLGVQRRAEMVYSQQLEPQATGTLCSGADIACHSFPSRGTPVELPKRLFTYLPLALVFPVTVFLLVTLYVNGQHRNWMIRSALTPCDPLNTFTTCCIER